MFCKKCGRELKDGTKFCDQCGTPQNVEAPKSPEPDQMQVPSESGTPSSNSQNVSHTTTVVQNTKTKKHSYLIFVIIVVVLIFLLVRCSCGNHAKNKHVDPAIHIESIAFNATTGLIEYEIKNISDKDIAYVKFQTYFYDRMGGALETSIAGDDYETLKYTGPLYPGEVDTAYYDWVLSMPSSTAVVYPKTITVTFADDEEITFENDFYGVADGFYGGKLKD